MQDFKSAYLPYKCSCQWVAIGCAQLGLVWSRASRGLRPLLARHNARRALFLLLQPKWSTPRKKGMQRWLPCEQKSKSFLKGIADCAGVICELLCSSQISGMVMKLRLIILGRWLRRLHSIVHIQLERVVILEVLVLVNHTHDFCVLWRVAKYWPSY